jgi:hypothetical protein
MSGIVITFTPLGQELISGIPNQVKITTNQPSIIYYTLDGTLPTVFSPQYFEPIQMPTDSGSVTLSVIAYFLDDHDSLVPSNIVSKTYQTDSSDIAANMRRLFAGVMYMYPGGLDIPYWYDYVGDVKISIDVPVEEFESSLKPSERNSDGSYRENVEGGVTKYISQTVNSPYSTPSDLNLFDPKALHIVIDGRSENLDEVILSNSPHMWLVDPSKDLSKEFRKEADAHHRSTGLMKAYYDRQSEIIVFYYVDTLTGRSIKSIQKLPKITPLLTHNSVISNPLTFQWFKWGRHQSL